MDIIPTINKSWFDLIWFEEYNIKFKGKQCKTSIKSLCVNGVGLQCIDSFMDLGHAVSSNDKYSMVTTAKASFWGVFNLFMFVYIDGMLERFWTHIFIFKGSAVQIILL